MAKTEWTLNVLVVGQPDDWQTFGFDGEPGRLRDGLDGRETYSGKREGHAVSLTLDLDRVVAVELIGPEQEGEDDGGG